MDDGVQRENGRIRIDYYKGAHTPWNMIPQYHQIKDQTAFFMNRKISMICAERDAAIEERDRALSEKKSAIEERDEAIRQRDAAISERDNAIRERDNAIAALQFQETTMNGPDCNNSQRGGTKRTHPSTAYITYKESDAFPLAAILPEPTKSKRTKEKKTANNKPPPRKGKRVGEDLNRHVTTDGSKAEWEAAQDLGLMNLISFDGETMPTPVCSCTGLRRQCYKWGNGGWQSSCCTTTLSMYPLPQMPNKRHSRMGGRKMSGSVFTRLLSRLAAEGHDLSLPLDLKNYWAKHGTNRYVTIK